jgi:hypothetical protein
MKISACLIHLCDKQCKLQRMHCIIRNRTSCVVLTTPVCA